MRFRRLVDAGIVLLGLCLATLVGEGLLRMFWPQRSSVVVGMFRSDPDAGYALKPDFRNEIRVPEYRIRLLTDAEGYRVPLDRPVTDDRAARILCIGDSFTFGVGVEAEEAFPELLEERLDAEWPGVWAVRNGGVGGYGPLRSARQLAGDQGEWEPDIVVHTLYLGNDLQDPRPATYLTDPIVRKGRMVSTDRPIWSDARMFLRTRSHLYAFLRQALYGVYVGTGLAEHGRYVDPVGQRVWPEWMENVSYPAAIRSVVEARDWCDANGARYLLVVAPTAWQVEDGRWDRYRRVTGLKDEELDRERAHRRVLEAMTDAGVETLDLLPVLRSSAAGDDSSPYFRHDAHWNRTGHAVAARALRERLEELGWVGPAGEASRAVVRADDERGAG